MSLNFEVVKPQNIDSTARHLLASPVAKRVDVSSVTQAEMLLMGWLKNAMENEEDLDVSDLFLPLYKGYWAHLVITGDPTFVGNHMESTLIPAVKVIQGNALDANEISFTVNKASTATGTKIVNVNFLVDLGKWSSV